MSVKTLVDVAIEDGFEDLSKLEFGTDAYEKGAASVRELTKLRIDIDALEAEAEDKKESRKQKRQDGRRQWVSIGLTAVGVVCSVVVPLYGYKSSNRIEFQSNDILTGTAGKDALKKIMSWKSKN